MKSIANFNNYNFLDWIAYIVVISGALNWGLIGVFNIDLISYLFQEGSLITRTLYIIIGVCGLRLCYMIYRKLCCDKC